MIQCPKCTHALPDWAQTCQFCGSDTKAVARPAPTPAAVRQAPAGQPKWVWPAYYACSIYFIISGGAEILQNVVAMNNTKPGPMGETVSGYSIFGIVISAIMVLVGLGLAARIEFIRGITNIYCWLVILSSALGLLGSLLGGMFLGPIALLWGLFELFNIGTAVFMIFLIGETD